MAEDQDVSTRLKLRMAQLGISQTQLAASLDVSAATVSQWLAAKKSPSKDNLEQAAAALLCAPEWLAYGAGDAPAVDMEAQRAEYEGRTGWRFRNAPPDGGRDYGNANVWAFDPSISTMVRDVLQNCRDAELSPGAPVGVTFRIIRLRGSQLDAFKKAVRWEEVIRHLKASAKIDQRLGRLIRHHLKRMETRDELLLLVVHDRATIGLLGDEFGKGNFAALCRNNLDSDKQSGSAGGAFGLGKAVLWRVSRFATVLFGSNLSAPVREQQQFARVFGRCDLPWHETAENNIVRQFAGPGWFGAIDEEQPGNERAVSYWNNDALLHDLKLERNDHASGTSIAVLGFHDPSEEQEEDDPAGLAEKIEEAVADWFWPDLSDGRLSVRVEVWDGAKLETGTDVSAAKHRPEFVEAYRKWKNDQTVEQLAKEGDVVACKVKLQVPPRATEPKHPASEHDAIVLIRRAGDGDSDRLNQLAMFRGVRMVVQYKPLKGICIGALPFHAVLLCGEAVGAEAADKMADRFLRTSEPPAHHDWGPTPDLQTEYKRGGVTAIREMIERAKAAIRAAVRPSVEDRSDGPRSLKELLKIGDVPTPKDKPRIVRPKVEMGTDGSWKVTASVRVRRGPDSWRVEPAVAFRQETGVGRPVSWRKLVALTNCVVSDGRLLISPNTDEARFTGETDPDTHPVDAAECCVTLDLRRAQREAGGGA